MKVLITGGAGFIGTNLAIYLRKRGYAVYVLDNDLHGRGDEFKIRNIKVYEDSVISTGAVAYAVDSMDAIVHLAGRCSSSASFKDPYVDFMDNALGTLNIAYCACSRGIPVIYASTCKVYPAWNVNTLTAGSVSEDLAVNYGARSPYGTSKLVGELYLQEFSEYYDVPVVINRLSTVFGPYQEGSAESGWLAWFVKAAREKLSVTVYGDGHQVRDCLWVGDLCELLEEQIRRPEDFSFTYNVGGGIENAVSLNHVIEHLGIKDVSYEDARPVDLNVYVSDMTKLFGITGWRPRMSVWEGINRLLEEAK